MFPWQSIELLCTCAKSIPLSRHSFVPSGLFRATCTSACVRGLCCQAFSCVRSCSCTSACLEPVLVSVCSQWSSVVHIQMAPSCICCSTLLPIVSRLFPPNLPSFHCIIYYTRETGALFPFCVGGSWLGCQDLLAMGAVSSKSWLPLVDAPGCLGHSTFI